MKVNYFNTDVLAEKYTDQFFESEFWSKLVTYSHEQTADRILEHISKQINLDVISGQFGPWTTSIDMDFRGNGVYVRIPCEMLIRYSGDYSPAKIKDLTIDENYFASDFSMFEIEEDTESMIMSVRFTWDVFFPFDDKKDMFKKTSFSRRAMFDYYDPPDEPISFYEFIEDHVFAVDDYMKNHDIYDILDKQELAELNRYNVRFKKFEPAGDDTHPDYVIMYYRCKYEGDISDLFNEGFEVSTYLPTYKSSKGDVDSDSYVTISLCDYDEKYSYWEVSFDPEHYYR